MARIRKGKKKDEHVHAHIHAHAHLPQSQSMEKENAPQNDSSPKLVDSPNRKRRLRFRRKTKPKSDESSLQEKGSDISSSVPLHFAPVSEQQASILGTSTGTSTGPQSQSQSLSRPHFSTMADMAILHNSVSTSVAEVDPEEVQYKSSSSSSQSLIAPSRVFRTRTSTSTSTTTSSATISTSNVMRLALQSRMYSYEDKSHTHGHGHDGHDQNYNPHFNSYDKWENLGYDPTVEESIECVFEHQLEDGLELNMEDDTDLNNDSGGFSSSFDCNGHGDGHGHEDPYSELQKKYYTSGKLLHVASYSPFPRGHGHGQGYGVDGECESPSSSPSMSVSTPASHKRSSPFRKKLHTRKAAKEERKANANSNAINNANESTSTDTCTYTCSNCKDGKKAFLGIDPGHWPQAPLLLRPCPGSGTKIIGVRYADSSEYITRSTTTTTDDNEMNTKQWWNEINIDRTDANANDSTSPYKYCPQCCCLPINNGNEPTGKILIIDFESELFQGSLLLRVRHTNGTTVEPYDDSRGYFNGYNRQYQSVIQGRFKRSGISMTRCVAGQEFSDSLKLPPAYVVKGALRIINFFAPRLFARFDRKKPFMVSPLGSTPQSVLVDKLEVGIPVGTFKADAGIGESLEEPEEDSRKLIPYSSNNPKSSVSRAKARKKTFDKMCADGDDSLTFQTDRVYTFESLQHLIDFRPFEVNLGSILGKMSLSPIMNGQPMNIMAAYLPPLKNGSERKNIDGIEKLWAFELWHEKMIDRMSKK